MDLKAVSLEETLQNIQTFLGNPADLVKIDFPKHEAAILYFDGLIDQTQLLAQIKNISSESFIIENSPWKPEQRDLKEILIDLAQGHVIFLQKVKKQLTFYSLTMPGWQLRPIEEPISEPVIRGPREGFTETLSENTAMIRRWINNPGLRVMELTVGEKTRTKVRLLYLDQVANPNLVKEVTSRISAIRIDGILESGYLEQLITDNRLTLFPANVLFQSDALHFIYGRCINPHIIHGLKGNQLHRPVSSIYVVSSFIFNAITDITRDK